MDIKTILRDEMGLSNKWKIDAANRILWMWMVVTIVFVIVVHTVGVPNLGTDVALGFGFIVTTVCIRLNRSGHTQFAIGLSGGMYWLGTAVGIYTGGALDVSGSVLFMPIVLMVSIFINARVGVFASLTAAIYITFLAWGMNRGIVPPLGYELNLMQKYTMSITPLCLLAIEIYFITQAMEKAFKFAQKQREITDEYAHHLELLNEDLMRSERRFRTIVEGAADGIVITDENGRIILANSPLSNWLGYAPEQLLTMTIDQINMQIEPDDDFIKRQKMLQTALKTAPQTLNTAFQRKDGSTFPVEARIVTMELNNQNVLLGMVRDVTERELAQAELESSLHEKELLLREIHHRVKNNLQIVTSMLRMQARQSNDPAAVDANKALQSRVRSMAIIHQQLYQNTNLANINFASYIRTLVNDIKTIHNNPFISFEFELDDVNLTVDHALTAGLIVNELVTNVIKHAFPDGQRGVVRCKLQKESPFIVIVIHDSGQGGVTQEQVQSGRTMGMQLLRLLTNQLKGNLTVNSDTDSGTQFILIFEDQHSD